MATNYDLYRQDFQNLDWSKGLTRDELMMSCVNCPPDLLATIPSNRKFYSFEEFWQFLAPPVAQGAEQSQGQNI